MGVMLRDLIGESTTDAPSQMAEALGHRVTKETREADERFNQLLRAKTVTEDEPAVNVHHADSVEDERYVETLENVEPQESHERQPEGESAAQPGVDTDPAKHPKTAAMRAEYPDWDRVFTEAKGVNVSGETAEAVHALPEHLKGHVQYALAKDADLRTALDRFPAAERAAQVQQLASSLVQMRSSQLAKSIQALPQEERAEMMRDGKRNELGARIVTSLAREIGVLDNGAQVAKYLLAHPEICDGFQSMSQQTAGLALGRISARLEDGHNRSALPVSSAPAPIRGLRGHSTRTQRPDVEDMSQAEYNAARARGQIGMSSQERQRRGMGA